MGRFICRWPWLVIAANLVIIAGLGISAPQLTIDTSFERYLPEHNAKRIAFNEFRHEYGSGERILVTLRPPEIYDLEFLERLRALHEELDAEVPYVDEITSLVNARRTYGTESSLVSEDLMEDWPESRADLTLLRERVESTPLYRNIVISEDGRVTTIVMEMDGSLLPGAADSGLDDELGDAFDDAAAEDLEATEGERATATGVEPGSLLTTTQTAEVIAALERVLAKYRAPEIAMHFTGLPIFAHELGQMITHDSGFFVTLSLSLIGFLLYFLFRRTVGVIYPLVIVALSLLCTLGAMARFDMPLTATTQILPSLLLAIGVGAAVHILAIFFKQYDAGYTREDAVIFALGHSGLAVLMTSLTTAASMASFNLTALQPTIDLGRAAPFGVMIAMLFSVTLLPALLVVSPVRRHAPDAEDALREPSAPHNRVDRILLGMGHLGGRHPWAVLGVCLLLWVGAFMGASKLHFSHSGVRWMPEGNPVRVAMEVVNRDLKGGNTFELLVDTGKKDGLRDPGILQAIAEMQELSKDTRVGLVYVGQSISIADILKETNKALHEGDPTHYSVPSSRELVSQELLLFENSGADDLEDVTNLDYRTARVMFTVPFVDALHYPRFARTLKANFREILDRNGIGEGVAITVTGFLTLAGETFSLLLTSMARSYSFAFTLIGLLMILLIGDLRLGLLSILPNLTPIFVALGLMGWLDVPLDISTMLMGSILIGIAVDDTIHFVHNYNRYYRRTGDSERAVEETLLTTGRAMLFTSIVLSLGFFVYMGSSLSNIYAFGWLNGLGVILAFFSDVVMMPALVVLVARHGKNPH